MEELALDLIQNPKTYLAVAGTGAISYSVMVEYGRRKGKKAVKSAFEEGGLEEAESISEDYEEWITEEILGEDYKQEFERIKSELEQSGDLEDMTQEQKEERVKSELDYSKANYIKTPILHPIRSFEALSAHTEMDRIKARSLKK